MNVLVSDDFRATIGIESKSLLGGISRLGHEIDRNTPTAKQWENVRSILNGMPQMSSLSEQDQMVLREVRQAAGEYYYRNSSTFLRARVLLEADPNHPLFEGVQERMTRDDKAILYDARSVHEEGSLEWAKDISQQVLEGERQVPDLSVTVTPEVVQEKITTVTAADTSFSWLVEPGQVVQGELAAQAVYDIVTAGDPVNNREFLFVKGAQLKYAESAAKTPAEKAEIREIRNKILVKVRELYGVNKIDSLTADQKLLLKDFTYHLSGPDAIKPSSEEGSGGGVGGFGATPGGGLSSKIWDRVTSSGNAKLDQLLQEIQNDIDNDPYNAHSPRYLTFAKARLTPFDRAILDLVGSPDMKLEALNKESRRGIIESWSSISTEPKTQEMFMLYPRAAVDEYMSNIEGTMDFWAEGALTDAQTYGIRRLGEFLTSGEFPEKIKDYMVAHQQAIESIYGAIDLNNLESHPFYKGRVDSLKEISDDINARTSMQRAYGAKKSGLELEKQQQVAGNSGDKGLLRIKTQHGGVNHAAYQFYNTTLRHFQQNFHTGLDDRVTGEELNLARILTEKFILKYKGILDPVFKASLEPEVDIPEAPKIPRELNEKIAKRIAREVSILSSVTGEEESAIWGGQSPAENDGQMMKPKGFSATTGTEIGLRGRAWFRWWEERW